MMLLVRSSAVAIIAPSARPMVTTSYRPVTGLRSIRRLWPVPNSRVMVATTWLAAAFSRRMILICPSTTSWLSSSFRKLLIRWMLMALSVMTRPLPLGSGEIEPQDETILTTVLEAVVGSMY